MSIRPTTTDVGARRSRTRRRSVALAALLGISGLMAVRSASLGAAGGPDSGGDPGALIHGATVVGVSGVPAPLRPVDLGLQLERDPEQRPTAALSPGLARAKREAERNRRVRDASRGRQRPVSTPDDAPGGTGAADGASVEVPGGR